MSNHHNIKNGMRNYIINEFIKESFTRILGSNGYKVMIFQIQKNYNIDIVKLFSEDPAKALTLLAVLLRGDEELHKVITKSLINHIESILKRSVVEDLNDRDKFYNIAKEYLQRLGKNTLPHSFRY